MDFHNSEPLRPITGTGTFFAAVLVVLMTIASPCSGQEQKTEQPAPATKKLPRPISDYTSRHFLIHTDLPRQEAEVILKHLEATLERISKYWGRRLRDPIECYIVDHLANWKDSDFPHSFARTLIAEVGGGAHSSLRKTRGKQKVKMTVYCSTQPGTVEHEIVHAYWGQTIGSSAPEWYHEGMAEMACQDPNGRSEIECASEVIQYLRAGSIRTATKVINASKRNPILIRSLKNLQEQSSTATDEEKADHYRNWIRTHGETVRSTREQYRWYWSLCHFLNHNSNYSSRFRMLGKRYLSHHPKSFQHLFSSVQPEMDFEFRFFLDRIDIGYDVNLCRWDWKRKFFNLNEGELTSIRINAAAGFQASGLYVTRDEKYTYKTDGLWRTSQKSPRITADGDHKGNGQLVGAIMTDYELSKPFELGTNGTFQAPREGKLFLRCEDRWNELTDNDGSVVVQFRLPKMVAASGSAQ